MENGEIAEFDTPQQLMQKKDGYLFNLVKSNGTEIPWKTYLFKNKLIIIIILPLKHDFIFFLITVF